MKLLNREFAYHRKVYACEECTHNVCVCTNESDTLICTKLGTLIVSKISKSDKIHRGVQEVGLGDASADYVDLALYRSEERSGSAGDGEGSR